ILNSYNHIIPASLNLCIFFNFLFNPFQIDIKPKRLKLIYQNVERGRQIWALEFLSTDDGVISRRAAQNIVRFYRYHFLQSMRRPVSLERPDFHFPKSLSPALRLASLRLLSNKRIRPDRSHVNFVFHHMYQFHHRNHPDRNFLVKRLPRTSVEKLDLSVLGQTSFFQFAPYFIFRSSIQSRSYRLVIERLRSPS